MTPFERTLLMIGLGLLIGVGTSVALLWQVPAQEYRIVPQTKTVIAAPQQPPELSSIQKNKMASQARVIQEIGHLPKTRIYHTAPRQLSAADFHCLSLNVFHEAKGESREGMLGVAHITLNRLDNRYRNKQSLCAVVYDAKQFSWTAHKKAQPKGKAWQDVLQVVRLAVNGLRIAGLEQTLHYHADWITHPQWSKQMVLSHVIGQHIYLLDNRKII